MTSRPAGPHEPAEHPVLAPSRLIFDSLGIVVDPVALVVMASGVRYADPSRRTTDEFGGFDAAFDLFEAAGFNCEQYRSVDAGIFLQAARREHDLAERRWRAIPFWSFWSPWSAAVGRSGSRAYPPVLPVALSAFDDDSVRVTSVTGDRRVDFEELTAAPQRVWGYAAPVPSLRAIIAPSRYDMTPRAERSLRLLLRRMAVAADGLPSLEAFLDSSPGPAAIEEYRRIVAQASAGDSTFARSTLAEAIERYGHGAVGDEVRAEFARSAELHRAFLDDDDDPALRETAVVERRALRIAAGGFGAEAVA